MVQIYDNVWVGKVEDLRLIENSPVFSILGVCKEPLHRRHAKLKGAVTEGYLGRAMPREEPEYLYAVRDHALYCNLIDTPFVQYISDEIIEKCMEFIDSELEKGQEVLIVCNQAISRPPSIALMWLIKHNMFNVNCKFREVFEDFKRDYYPMYDPSEGFYEYVKNFWNERKMKNYGQET